MKIINPHETFVTCSIFSLKNDLSNGNVLLKFLIDIPILNQNGIQNRLKLRWTLVRTVVITLSYIDGV